VRTESGASSVHRDSSITLREEVPPTIATPPVPRCCWAPGRAQAPPAARAWPPPALAAASVSHGRQGCWSNDTRAITSAGGSFPGCAPACVNTVPWNEMRGLLASPPHPLRPRDQVKRRTTAMAASGFHPNSMRTTFPSAGECAAHRRDRVRGRDFSVGPTQALPSPSPPPPPPPPPHSPPLPPPSPPPPPAGVDGSTASIERPSKKPLIWRLTRRRSATSGPPTPLGGAPPRAAHAPSLPPPSGPDQSTSGAPPLLQQSATRRMVCTWAAARAAGHRNTSASAAPSSLSKSHRQTAESARKGAAMASWTPPHRVSRRNRPGASGSGDQRVT